MRGAAVRLLNLAIRSLRELETARGFSVGPEGEEERDEPWGGEKEGGVPDLLSACSGGLYVHDRDRPPTGFLR
jgi:hypothetical protein